MTARLWNAAERAETRANGRLATELELALPHELTAAQRKRLLMDFIAPIIEWHGVAADVAIHEPGEGRDHRNIHAHVLFTHRTLDEDGFIEKVKGQRKDIGLSTFAMGSEAVLEIRQAWEQHVNLAYERAGLDIRVDHRSHADRGIAQEPTKHLGPSASAMERREPGSSDRGDINRDIEERNAALRERAALEIEARKAEAELAAAQKLAEMERAAAEREARAAAAGRRDEIRPAFDMAARTTEPAAPIHDREAAEAAWQKQIIDAAAAQAEQDARAAAKGRTDDMRPDRAANIDRQAEQAMQAAHAAAKGRTDDLSGMAADIRMAWSLSRTASELEDALAARGISLAVPGADEAQASQRTAAFAKEVGNFARSFAEGEIVAVDGRGRVYRLDERTTGQTQPEIAGRLAGIDRVGLLNIADTKEVMQAAALEAWKAEQRAAREQARPASRIESRIADCAEQAGRLGATVLQDATGRQTDRVEALADSFRPDDERRLHAVTVQGREAFAARLEDAGIAIVRVTDADAKALDTLRAAELMEREAAQGARAYKGQHFAELLPGELAAVTRNGDVHRINPDKFSDAKKYLDLAADLPGVIETRARFEIENEQTAALWKQQRGAGAEVRQDYAAERESQWQHAQTVREVRQFNQEVGEAVDTGFKAADKQAGQAAAAEQQQAQDSYDRQAEAQRVKDIARTLQVDPAPTAAERFGTPKPHTAEREQDRDYGLER